MTLQCCGPHSARPASTNLCLYSDSMRAHTHTGHHQTHCFKPWACAKISFHRQQLQMLVQAATDTHKHSDSRCIFASPFSAPYTCILWRLQHQHQSIKKRLNLLLALIVSTRHPLHHRSAPVSIFMSSAEGLTGHTGYQSLAKRGSPKTSSSLLLSGCPLPSKTLLRLRINEPANSSSICLMTSWILSLNKQLGNQGTFIETFKTLLSQSHIINRADVVIQTHLQHAEKMWVGMHLVYEAGREMMMQRNRCFLHDK